MKKHASQNGFSLIEMVIAIAIVAILTSLAYPSFQDTIRRNRMAASVNDFMSGIHQARSEALKRNRRVFIRANEVDSTTAWQNGFTICIDDNNDGICGTGAGDITLRTLDELSGNNIIVNSAVDQFVFLPSGFRATTAGTDTLMSFCSPGDTGQDSPYARAIVVSQAGHTELFPFADAPFAPPACPTTT